MATGTRYRGYLKSSEVSIQQLHLGGTRLLCIYALLPFEKHLQDIFTRKYTVCYHMRVIACLGEEDLQAVIFLNSIENHACIV